MTEINLQLIKSRRKALKITLLEMSEALGLKNASSYYKYEKGEYKFNGEQLPIVCKMLKMRLNEIFSDQNVAKIAK
jgi:transcriptional regulator with XRE-family HTH domain